MPYIWVVQGWERRTARFVEEIVVAPDAAEAAAQAAADGLRQVDVRPYAGTGGPGGDRRSPAGQPRPLT